MDLPEREAAARRQGIEEKEAVAAAFTSRGQSVLRKKQPSLC